MEKGFTTIILGLFYHSLVLSQPYIFLYMARKKSRDTFPNFKSCTKIEYKIGGIERGGAGAKNEAAILFSGEQS
jgi:hypothetical protein